VEEVAVRSDLIRQRNEARSKMARGVLLTVSAPFTLFAAFVAGYFLGAVAGPIVMIAGAIFASSGVIVGIGTTMSGAATHRRLTAQMRNYEHVRELPEARIVESSRGSVGETGADL
jgi:hypothetical protein